MSRQINLACRIFVGNLDSDKTSRQQLEDVFGVHGEIAAVEIKKGYCFIEFTTPEAAQNAIKLANGQIIGNRRIECDVAKGKKREREDNLDFGNKRKKRRENDYDSNTNQSSLQNPSASLSATPQMQLSSGYLQQGLQNLPGMQTIQYQNQIPQPPPMMANPLFSAQTTSLLKGYNSSTNPTYQQDYQQYQIPTTAYQQPQQKSLPLPAQPQTLFSSVPQPAQVVAPSLPSTSIFSKKIVIPFLVTPGSDPVLRSYAQEIYNTFVQQLAVLPHVGFEIYYAGEPSFFNKFNELVQGTPRYTVIIRPENQTSQTVSFRAFEMDGSTHGFENTPYLDALRYIIHLENLYSTVDPSSSLLNPVAAPTNISNRSETAISVQNPNLMANKLQVPPPSIVDVSNQNLMPAPPGLEMPSVSTSGQDTFVAGESKRNSLQSNLNSIMKLLFQSGNKNWNQFYSSNGGKDFNEFFNVVEKSLKTVQALSGDSDPRKTKLAESTHMKSLLSSLDQIMNPKK